MIVICFSPETFYPQRTVRDERYKMIHNLLPDLINPVYQLCMTMNKAWKTGEDPYDGLPKHKLSAYDQWKHPVVNELYDLNNDQKLIKLDREVQRTFIDGEFVHLRNRPDFEWQYLKYLRPAVKAP